MSALTGFVLSFLVTLLLLGGVVLTGRRARRRRHIPLVIATVAALGTTIAFAERLGTHYDLEGAGWITHVHLFLAKTTAVCYLLPLVTGPLTIRRPALRRWHGRLAWFVVTLTVLSAVTGSWMLLRSRPL